MRDLLAFVAELRAAGLAVGTDRIVLAAQALASLPGDPYRSLRVTLCTHAGDLSIFDAVWASRSAAEVDPDGVAVGSVEPGADTAPAGAETEPAPAGQVPDAGNLDDLTRRDVRRLTPPNATRSSGSSRCWHRPRPTGPRCAGCRPEPVGSTRPPWCG